MTESPAEGGSSPYGPNTARVRRFLVRLAALGHVERAQVVARFASLSGGRAFATAEVALADAIERSGRADARDALGGPLLQIARHMVPDGPAANTADEEADALDDLDPVAEPALAALMALLAEDLISAEHRRLLYSAFDEVIPLDRLDG